MSEDGKQLILAVATFVGVWIVMWKVIEPISPIHGAPFWAAKILAASAAAYWVYKALGKPGKGN